MSTSTSLNTAAPSGSLNAYASGAGAEPAGAAQAPSATAPHADPLAKLASLFGLHAAATQRASAPTYGGPNKTSLRECSESGLSDAPTTKVQPGETSLEQVAERLGFDAQDLARINPRIQDPAALSVGQDVRLPQEAKLSARADVEWPRCPTDTDADPRREVAEAHRIYKETGELPQTRNQLAPIEIKEGRTMSRAERYDAMLAKQGKTFAGIDALERDDRDPSYVTRREFVEEASARHTAAYNACKDDNIRPGTIYNCIQDLARRDGPQRYRDAREAQERLTWQQWQHAQQQIGAIASSGPLGLIGRGVGHAFGGLKGQEIGGAIGGMADTALSFAVGARQIANQRGYNGSAGLELRREAPANAASAPPSIAAETPVAAASAASQPRAIGPASAGPAQPMRVADTMIARALDRHSQGLPPADATAKLIVDTLAAEKFHVAHNVDFQLREKEATKTPFPIAGPVDAKTRTEREAILSRLRDAGVGKEGGTEDQLIVRQILLTDPPSGVPPVFYTADRRLINGLAELAGIKPDKGWGKYENAAEFLKGEKRGPTFEVEVEGRKMTVRPIQPIRPEIEQASH